jgi:hypothetical protein
VQRVNGPFRRNLPSGGSNPAYKMVSLVHVQLL